MSETTEYLLIQVEETNTENVWTAIEKLAGVVSVSLTSEKNKKEQ